MAACLAAASLAASAQPAAASVTIGQLAPDGAPETCSSSGIDYAQPTVTSGNAYVVPGAGTITSWSHNARAGVGQTLTMKVFRKVADPATFQAIGHDGPRPLAESSLNTFPASIAVEPGDVLGLNQANSAGSACVFSAPGESFLIKAGNLADGERVAFNSSPDYRLNVSAVFVYSNAFTLGRATRNKKRGTATLTLNVPNPGELTGSGKGVKVAGATGAVISKTVAPGDVQLLIKAKGKKKRKLNDNGKVKLNVAITYTPAGGDASTQSLNVKLKKKL